MSPTLAVPYAETIPDMTSWRWQALQLQEQKLSIPEIWDTLRESDFFSIKATRPNVKHLVETIRCTPLDSLETADVMTKWLRDGLPEKEALTARALCQLTSYNHLHVTGLDANTLLEISLLSTQTPKKLLKLLWDNAQSTTYPHLLHNPSLEVEWETVNGKIRTTNKIVPGWALLGAATLNKELIHAAVTSGERLDRALTTNPHMTRELVMHLVNEWSIAGEKEPLDSLMTHLHLFTNLEEQKSLLSFCYEQAERSGFLSIHFWKQIDELGWFVQLYPDVDPDSVSERYRNELLYAAVELLETEDFRHVAASQREKRLA